MILLLFQRSIKQKKMNTAVETNKLYAVKGMSQSRLKCKTGLVSVDVSFVRVTHGFKLAPSGVASSVMTSIVVNFLVVSQRLMIEDSKKSQKCESFNSLRTNR